MKEEARRRGVDLLVVDSGDRVDGNGFVDGQLPDHVKGYSAMQFFQHMPYDVITTGNHELYNFSIAVSTYENIAKHYGARYVTSNVNLTLPMDENGEVRMVTLGNRYRKFRTEQNRRVTAFGPLFNFRGEIVPSEPAYTSRWKNTDRLLSCELQLMDQEYRCNRQARWFSSLGFLLRYGRNQISSCWLVICLFEAMTANSRTLSMRFGCSILSLRS